MARRHINAFTLLELLIACVIVAILTTFMSSAYNRSRERATTKEAIAGLRVLAEAEKAFRMEHGTYYPAAADQTVITTINTNLKLDLTELNWDYAITGGASTFIASATRIAGPFSACVYTFDSTQDFADGEADPNGSCP